MIKIISWNINGVNKLEEKGFPDFIRHENPDIICLQETHTKEPTIQTIARSLGGYEYAAADSVRMGTHETCGVATLTREKPQSVLKAFIPGRTGYEGRILISEFPGFLLYNCYFPTSTGSTAERRKYYTELKRSFYHDCYRSLASAMCTGKEIILCGDFNTARDERDVADAEKKQRTSGFTRDDRDDIGGLLSLNLVDAFRLHNEEPGHYTWWYNDKMKFEKKGWRIDYFLLSLGIAKRVMDCTHKEEQVRDDHCPVILELSEQ